MPAKAYDGDIKLSILNDEGEEIANTEANEKFVYQKKMLVTTFLGTMYDGNTKYDLKMDLLMIVVALEVLFGCPLIPKITIIYI